MTSEWKTVQLLVVDDEPLLVNLYEHMLQEFGYQVHTAYNGQEALHMLNKLTPPIDLVITDLRMPRMDGVTLRDKIRDRNPHLPVVAVSAWVNHPTYAEAVREQFDGWIRKPFELQELHSLITEILAREAPHSS